MKKQLLNIKTAAVIFILFISWIVYSLSPTVNDVSGAPFLKPLIGKQSLKQKTYLTKCKKGQYSFIENVLTTDTNSTNEIILEMDPGSDIEIENFHTYTSNLGSGFTYLYALGSLNDAKGNKINFEYDLGTVGKNIYEDASYELPKVPWQDANSKSIRIPAEN